MAPMIKHNGIEYYQDQEGTLISITGILAEIGGDIHSILPTHLHNPHAIRRLHGDLNSDDPSRTCKHCRTSYRASDQRDPDRCPYCWRLI